MTAEDGRLGNLLQLAQSLKIMERLSWDVERQVSLLRSLFQYDVPESAWNITIGNVETLAIKKRQTAKPWNQA
ncbi:uncharacterized protein ARMOST_06646 [Armillaria ostoyae]|uniref:Uncharacterized protein n=1 Tax=Armillaria ostoyae TaxID=47428 RepID=A0A284R3K4_ARMOS|nr:uncharacterized protein ARMOST_06646 [Armillaria ostoyae]